MTSDRSGWSQASPNRSATQSILQSLRSQTSAHHSQLASLPPLPTRTISPSISIPGPSRSNQSDQSSSGQKDNDSCPLLSTKPSSPIIDILSRIKLGGGSLGARVTELETSSAMSAGPDIDIHLLRQNVDAAEIAAGTTPPVQPATVPVPVQFVSEEGSYVGLLVSTAVGIIGAVTTPFLPASRVVEEKAEPADDSNLPIPVDHQEEPLQHIQSQAEGPASLPRNPSPLSESERQKCAYWRRAARIHGAKRSAPGIYGCISRSMSDVRSELSIGKEILTDWSKSALKSGTEYAVETANSKLEDLSMYIADLLFDQIGPERLQKWANSVGEYSKVILGGDRARRWSEAVGDMKTGFLKKAGEERRARWSSSTVLTQSSDTLHDLQGENTSQEELPID